MARREKDVDMPRRGNFKGGMGQTSATGGAKPKKTRGLATTEAVKKMKQKESSMAKPKAKPSKPAMSGASRSTANKVSAKSGASRSTSGKVSAKSGATRGTSGKIDNSIGAQFKRGMKRLFGTDYARKTTGPGPEKFDRTSAGGKKVNELTLRKSKYKSRKQARTGR